MALRDGEQPLVDDFVVCDNGSTDATAQRARSAGARIVRQDRPGYGIACLTAIDALEAVDIVLFTDGDRSFDAVQCIRLLDAIAAGADLAVGSRALGRMEPGALSVAQRAGNRLASLLIRLLWGESVTDLGPYRAIRTDALGLIDMRGQGLRLDDRDADQGDAVPPASRRNTRRYVPPTLRQVEGGRNLERRRRRQRGNSFDDREATLAASDDQETLGPMKLGAGSGRLVGTFLRRSRTSSSPRRRICLKQRRCVRR